jgi:hypothetical protein
MNQADAMEPYGLERGHRRWPSADASFVHFSFHATKHQHASCSDVTPTRDATAAEHMRRMREHRKLLPMASVTTGAHLPSIASWASPVDGVHLPSRAKMTKNNSEHQTSSCGKKENGEIGVMVCPSGHRDASKMTCVRCRFL